MFRNRWFALLFVALTLAGVTTLVGTEKSHGALQDATDQIAQQKAQAEQLTGVTQEVSPSDESGDNVVMATDEELIDPAQGEDPTPIDEFATANPPDPAEMSNDVVIVSRDVPGQAQPQAPSQAPPQQ
ncbi:hypothetical protein [Tsuneonella rigui]|uniref:hypothetical protein n=1 Tax=Tsuneonella rigui TaxID=1708790 RepID=UPI000F7F55CC|nr:hypothetical protein [Tsuneonella rigui]